MNTTIQYEVRQSTGRRGATCIVKRHVADESWFVIGRKEADRLIQQGIATWVPARHA